MKTNLLCVKKERKTGRFLPGLLALLIILAGSGAIPAKTHAAAQQRITVRMEQATARQVVDRIQETTRYRVSYVDEDLRLIPRRSYNLSNASIREVMDNLVADTRLSWTEENGIIIISRREAPVQEAATVTVTGLVRDSNGNPVAGATVSVKGTTRGTLTDANGQYSISASKTSVLVYSFLGFVTVEETVGEHTVMNITLHAASFDIGAVVISTGYQEISKEKSTVAAATVDDEELAKRYTTNLLDNMEGRVAGLGTYGGKPMIRGVNSLRAANSPLLVVDGLPVEGGIEDINPFDVKSVTVLKDAAATAIYGARAANGIIVVVTKQAPRWEQGGRNVTVDASANITVYQKKNTDYADNFYMTPAQQVEKEKEWAEYYFNGGVIADPVANVATTITNGNSLAPVMYNYYLHAKGDISASELENRLDGLKKNNFAKEYAEHVLRPRTLQQYNVAVRSAGEKFQSNLVLNFRGDNTGYVNQRDNRFNIFYKGTYNVTDWMSVNFSVNAIVDDQKEVNGNRVGNDDPTNPFNVPSYYRLLNDDGSYADYTTNDYNIYNTMAEEETKLNSVKFNHLREMYRDMTKTSRQHMRYHADLKFRILDGLSAEAQFTYEDVRSEASTYSEADSYTMRFMKNVYTSRTGTEGNYTYKYLLPQNGGKLNTVTSRGAHWTARAQANYSQYFCDHSVDVIAGLEFRQTRRWGTRNVLWGYDDQLQTQASTSVSYTDLYAFRRTDWFKSGWAARDYIYNYLIEPAVGLVQDETHRYGSGYVNASYMYDRRYNAFASFRRDFTDVFGLEAKYRGKPLWSVGVGWNVHNEDFMKGAQWVDFLKARLTYGVTGNIYHKATSYMTASTTQNNATTKQPWSEIKSPANPDLTWEQTATLNAGVDFSLFENRLTGSLDWYRKKTTDLFSEVTIESTKGFAYLIMNSANVINNGVELSLSYDWIMPRKPGGFFWNTSATFAYNRNEITRIEERAQTVSNLAKGESYKVGYSVNSLFSTQFAGIEGVEDAAGRFTGLPTWYDSNGDVVRKLGTSDVDALVYSGQKDPKTTIGLTNYFSYKGVSLNILMVYYGGHHLRAHQVSTITQGLPYRPLQSYWLRSWTPRNTETDIPGFGQYAGTSNPTEMQYSDVYVRRGDFIKIRNIVLGYEVPERIASKIGLKNLALSFQINNPKPLWLANDAGIDPETYEVSNPYVFTRGMRMPTSYVFGMSINF